MPHISSYALQYANVSYAQVSASGLDLFITERTALTPAQVASLIAQGRVIAAYVDISVTDSARAYWNPSWTTNGQDTGAVTASAPSWLQNAPLYDFTGDGVPDARIVNYWDSAWRQLVIDQAVGAVQAGYNGIFLDDVGIYWALAQKAGQPSAQVLAQRMVDLLEAVSTAIKAVNPDAFIITNGNPYLGTDAGGGAYSTRVLSSIDAMLMENPTPSDMNGGVTFILNKGVPLLGLSNSAAPTAATFYERGFVPFIAPHTNYDSFGVQIGPQTAGADTLLGGDGPNQLNGAAGDDRVEGGKGADTLTGGAGADVFVFKPGSGGDVVTDFTVGTDRIDLTGYGSYLSKVQTGADTLITFAMGDTVLLRNVTASSIGDTSFIGLSPPSGVGPTPPAGYNPINGTAGRDNLTGTAGSDAIQGLDGNDALIGGIGDDWIYGGAGADRINGAQGADVLIGGAGNDIMTGAVGADRFVFLPGGGADIVTDFSHVQGDRLDLSAFGGYVSKVQSGADTLITLADGGSILLTGVSASALTASDFIFGASPPPPPPPPAGPTPPAGYNPINGTADRDSLTGTAGSDAIQGLDGNDALIGGIGDDWIYGGAGADRINGAQGADVLIGGAGNDIMTGAVGADRFVFLPGGGADIVTDFSHAQGDRLDLSAFGGYVSMVQNGADTLITFADGGTVTLTGVAVSTLGAGDFIF